MCPVAAEQLVLLSQASKRGRMLEWERMEEMDAFR